MRLGWLTEAQSLGALLLFRYRVNSSGLVGATRAQAPPQSQPPATASEKPFLRPQVPTQPETQIVNFDPNATWP